MTGRRSEDSQTPVTEIVQRIWACPECGATRLDASAEAESVYCVGKRGSGHDVAMIPFAHEAFLVEAQTFLASIASAESQGTREQTDWMIAQAREGLRRAGGHDPAEQGGRRCPLTSAA
jgi:hypothetical protein